MSTVLKLLAKRAAQLLVLIGVSLLAACAGGPKYSTRDGPDVVKNGQYRAANLRPYTVRGDTYRPYVPDVGDTLTGTASWYGHESGSLTATGERFDPNALSAAHKTWPLPSVIEVTNLDNGRTLRLRLNDRGPFVDGRLIDLSKGAAQALGVHQVGTARVRIKFLGPAELGARPVYAATPQPADSDRQRYRVQIGAFSERTNAERVSQSLSARIDERRGLYVVSLGPFEGAQKAELYRQQVLAAGYFDAILTRDE
ncbi:septal ring lytic transglycosylase RlpA family protein [Asticcacaulis sp. DXS10W]|uniref:Endolytic peptidoglycan transglycosylase RlpA n=1 Tax=Asticcacaulis currens TaxID=2984210 RepID=A0ABT5IGS5_9CAUL|nr:septal ring lytic transglycosylase RlpA family protein [Asticcacaulis currens]MDC7695403.1 septal ring lytic transglycosylase RlpA family protein [Asticcacaulis currens]